VNISDLQTLAHGLAKFKGWWPELDAGESLTPSRIAVALALIHSEVSEALEEVRNGDVQPYWVHEGVRHDQNLDPKTYKPEGLPAELADVVIRVADLAGALRIDLQQAITEKMEYNRHRSHRHGGRAL
jgi:NTP pyrophosphatase (non-canonical NTP hydrolase)